MPEIIRIIFLLSVSFFAKEYIEIRVKVYKKDCFIRFGQIILITKISFFALVFKETNNVSFLSCPADHTSIPLWLDD